MADNEATKKEEDKDYYAQLGVTKAASAQEITVCLLGIFYVRWSSLTASFLRVGRWPIGSSHSSFIQTATGEKSKKKLPKSSRLYPKRNELFH